MDLRDYVRVLRLRWRLIVICVLVAVTGAMIMALSATATYRATTQLFVGTQDQSQISSAYQGSLFTQQRVKSYVDVVSTPPVVEPVVNRLGLKMTPSQLASKVHASAPNNTVLLNISVTDPSPKQAALIANAVAQQFTAVVNKLETAPGQSASPIHVSILKTAAVASSPVSPRPKLNLLLGLAIGVVVGVGLAIAREQFDTRIRAAADIQDRFALPILAVIGFDPKAVERPLITSEPHSARAEAFRRIRTNLQFVNVDQLVRSVAVTSSVPEEGKTTTTANLAIALAEAGNKVILVEGDLRRPRLAKYLGLESAAGLTDVLIHRASVDEVLQPWGETGNLRVLTSGPIPPNPSEILGSQRMVDVIRTLERRAFVIIDSPPLLPVTDAAVISTVANGVMIVVRAARTRREQLGHAVESLRSVGATIFGVVLNMAPTSGPDAYRYEYTYEYADADLPLPTAPITTLRPRLPGPNGSRPVRVSPGTGLVEAPTEAPKAPVATRALRRPATKPNREAAENGAAAKPRRKATATKPLRTITLPDAEAPSREAAENGAAKPRRKATATKPRRTITLPDAEAPARPKVKTRQGNAGRSAQ